MPLVIQIFERFKKYVNKQKAQNFTQLPPGAKNDLSKYLKRDEEILFIVRNFRAIYKAPRWVDSNTFFNSWLILTNQRIMIAKNSSSFKRVREILLNNISQTDYETEISESKLTIHSPGTVDIIEFFRESRTYCEGLEQKVSEALENARQSGGHSQTLDTVFCDGCGRKVPSQSKFCSECGVKL